MPEFCVLAFYKFVALEDPAALQAPLRENLARLGVKGTVLLAREGINGTLAAPDGNRDALRAALQALPGCADLESKVSTAREMPFLRLKVRLKQEIVTMGVPEADPTCLVGNYVSPQAWNDLITDPDTVVIDTRNHYEVTLGTFQGAIDPDTAAFRDFPAWFDAFRTRLEAEGRTPRIAMFCTGGIRCEKATSYVRAAGLDQVYHLQGGILKYLETVPEADSLWQGECFVFDDRVSVGHGLRQGGYELCHACRMPVSASDRAQPAFEPGVSCPHCHGTFSPERLAALRERQKQVQLAEDRGEQHIGDAVVMAPRRRSGL